MESKKKEKNKGNGNVIHSGSPAGFASQSVGFSLDADFLSFLSETTSGLDFKSFKELEDMSSTTTPLYTRYNVPTKQIPKSVIRNILEKPKLHHFAMPHFEAYRPNCSQFGIGFVGKTEELTGVRHLRIDFGEYALIYIATRANLTKLQAKECFHWFRTQLNWEQVARHSPYAEDLQMMPVPVTFDDGTSYAKASIVDGPLLAVPDFATRAAFMIDAQIPGWELHTYSQAQINQIAPLVFSDVHPKTVYSQALGIAFKELWEFDDSEIAEHIAEHLSEYLPKYEKDPDLALRLGHQYVRTARIRNLNGKNYF